MIKLLAHGRWFSPGTPASSTTKTGRHDIAEILLKVALNTKNQSINQPDWGSPTISLRYMYSYPIWLWGSLQSPSGICTLIQSDYEGPPQFPSGICTLIQSDYEGPSPQSPSCICTVIQSDYEGPPTISLVYMYSYPIWLWGSPHNLPQVYVLLSNRTMRVPPQLPSGICTLI